MASTGAGIMVITSAWLNARFLGQDAFTIAGVGRACGMAGAASHSRLRRMLAQTRVLSRHMPVCWKATSHLCPWMTYRITRMTKRTIVCSLSSVLVVVVAILR